MLRPWWNGRPPYLHTQPTLPGVLLSVCLYCLSERPCWRTPGTKGAMSRKHTSCFRPSTRESKQTSWKVCMVYSPHRLFSRASFLTTTNRYNSNTVLKGYPAGWAVCGDTAVGHSTMVEAWGNWHNFYITPKHIIRVETRGPATLKGPEFLKSQPRCGVRSFYAFLGSPSFQDVKYAQKLRTANLGWHFFVRIFLLNINFPGLGVFNRWRELYFFRHQEFWFRTCCFHNVFFTCWSKW